VIPYLMTLAAVVWLLPAVALLIVFAPVHPY
jgi:hypothetical protein